MEIEHVAWSVKDPIACADWYVLHLGMKILRSSGPPAYARFLADSTGRLLLEIYNNPKVKVPDYGNMDPLLLHLAFRVQDVEKERDRLVQSGATVVDPFTRTETGDEMAMLRDPWGLALQLMKRAQPMG